MSVPYVAIGTPQGLARLREFVQACQMSIVSCRYSEPGEEDKDVRLWPPFPGFQVAFQCQLPAEPAWHEHLDRKTIETTARDLDPHHRAYELVNLYLDGIRRAAERDESYPLVICVEPDDIWRFCRPKSRVEDGVGTKVSAKERRIRSGHRDFFLEYDPEQYQLSVDFRRQLKARAMEHGIPIQLIRESTLSLDAEEGDRSLTRLSDRAWNLMTTCFYKAGGKPWRLATARDGVCYVGLVFRKADDKPNSRSACCAAQMFLDTGDGVVFRGEFGPWYSPKTKQFHLDEKHAEELLRGVIETYYEQGGKNLKEIFLHSRSTIWDTEFRGYRRACPDGVKLVGVRVMHARDGLRLYRPGRWCVLRGTVWLLSDQTAYLWASGFKPELLTYDGWETPAPLRIDIQHGAASVERVAADILGLTKLNYNACRVGDAEPVTIGFSDKVGEVLISNPTISVRRPSFRFYI